MNAQKKPRMGWINLWLWAAIVIVLLALALDPEEAGAQRSNDNETPRQVNASLFQPCAFELGSLSGPLKELADSQHYTYFEYTNTIGVRPAGTMAATLDAFATLDAHGIVEIATHGSPRWLLMECYPLDGIVGMDDDGDGMVDESRRVQLASGEILEIGLEGEDLRNTRLNRICNGTDRPGGVLLDCPQDVFMFSGVRQVVVVGGQSRSVPTEYGIGLSKSGIQKLLSPTAHSIVFVGACEAFALRDVFPASIEYFGYTRKCVGQSIEKDTSTLFKRLAGLEYDGKARQVGGDGALFPNIPDRTCTAFGRGGFSSILRHGGPRNTTVAPIVAWTGVANSCRGGVQAFSPKDETFVPIPKMVNGRVTFDTAMDTGVDPTTVLTIDQSQGENTCRAELKNVEWANNREITFDLDLKEPGDFKLRVHNDRAKSQHNDRELDGNQSPRPDESNGVGPNRDDYVAKNECGS